jgi:IS5 family transposase
MAARQKIWLKRRKAVEPAVRHLKADHRMGLCWLKESEGDALHAVLCAAGFNIRWLLRAMAGQAAKTTKELFFILFWMCLCLQGALAGYLAANRPTIKRTETGSREIWRPVPSVVINTLSA